MSVLTVDDIRRERETREQRAIERASKLAPDGDYYASGTAVLHRGFGKVVECESHWDACLVLLALPGGTLHDMVVAKTSARLNNDLARRNAATIDRLRGDILHERGDPSNHT